MLAFSASTGIGTIFDKAFVAAHPALAAGLAVGSFVLAAVSQAAYTIGSAMKAQAQAASSETLPVLGGGTVLP